MKADEIYGTKNPTPHRLLLDARFELPFGESFRPVFSEFRERPAVTASAPSILFPLGQIELKGRACSLPKCQRSELHRGTSDIWRIQQLGLLLRVSLCPSCVRTDRPRPGPSFSVCL